VVYLPGKGVLYPGSLIQNLTNFVDTPERVNRAIELCQAIGIHETINKLPYGYKSQIETCNTVSLNDGLVQAITIIRAIVQEPKIIIFDHGDALLDIATEQKLVTILKDLSATIVAYSVSDTVQQILTPLAVTVIEVQND
jgi:ABC-type bacteriocin/lantibiotic exporter with double-glycine peptidase domain